MAPLAGAMDGRTGLTGDLGDASPWAAARGAGSAAGNWRGGRRVRGAERGNLRSQGRGRRGESHGARSWRECCAAARLQYLSWAAGRRSVLPEEPPALSPAPSARRPRGFVCGLGLFSEAPAAPAPLAVVPQAGGNLTRRSEAAAPAARPPRAPPRAPLRRQGAAAGPGRAGPGSREAAPGPLAAPGSAECREEEARAASGSLPSEGPPCTPSRHNQAPQSEQRSGHSASQPPGLSRCPNSALGLSRAAPSPATPPCPRTAVNVVHTVTPVSWAAKEEGEGSRAPLVLSGWEWRAGQSPSHSDHQGRAPRGQVRGSEPRSLSTPRSRAPGAGLLF